MRFGFQLMAWRLARGMTQAQLAQASGVSRPNISAIEQGKRDITLHTLHELAHALELRPGQILDEHPPLHFAELDRYQVDEIARAIVSGRRHMGAELNQFCDDLAALVSQKLRVFAAPGWRRVARFKWQRWQAQQAIVYRYGEPLVERILKRVPKHLPHAA